MPQQMLCSWHASLLSAAAASLAAFCTHSRQDTEDTEVATRTHLISSTLSAWLALHLEATWRLGSMTCALLRTQSGSECGHSEVNINYLHPHTHIHMYIYHVYCGKFNDFKWALSIFMRRHRVSVTFWVDNCSCDTNQMSSSNPQCLDRPGCVCVCECQPLDGEII